MDPEENDSHLIQPEQLGQLTSQIISDPEGSPFDDLPKQNRCFFPDRRRLLTERAQRAAWIGGCPEQNRREAMVGQRLPA